jgi:hypothetical protein
MEHDQRHKNNTGLNSAPTPICARGSSTRPKIIDRNGQHPRDLGTAAQRHRRTCHYRSCVSGAAAPRLRRIIGNRRSLQEEPGFFDATDESIRLWILELCVRGPLSLRRVLRLLFSHYGTEWHTGSSHVFRPGTSPRLLYVHNGRATRRPGTKSMRALWWAPTTDFIYNGNWQLP